MTFGGGGHSRMVLQEAPELVLVAADRDPLAFEMAKSLRWEVDGYNGSHSFFYSLTLSLVYA